MGSGGASGRSPPNRAQKFEDEKRRIVDSCFSKKDETGAGKSAATKGKGCVR